MAFNIHSSGSQPFVQLFERRYINLQLQLQTRMVTSPAGSLKSSSGATRDVTLACFRGGQIPTMKISPQNFLFFPQKFLMTLLSHLAKISGSQLYICNIIFLTFLHTFQKQGQQLPENF